MRHISIQNRKLAVMFLKKIILSLVLSLICGSDLNPIDIINSSINRLNNIDIEFESNIKQQSTVDNPIDYSLAFKAYWPIVDSIYYYNYIKFNKPIDYKDIEIWSLYNSDTLLINKRLPIDNKITSIEKDSDNTDIINLFNFMQLFEDIKDKNFSIKDSKINGKDIFFIKAFSNKSKKKATRIYIDKINYAIYKIEWSDKKGRINKSIIFDDWISIDEIDFSSRVIYEDIKNGSKITCKLENINFNQIGDTSIKEIEAGFNLDK